MNSNFPTENEHFPGYFLIPGNESFSISKDGKLIDSEIGRQYEWSTIKPHLKNRRTGGYKFNRIGQRHRLLALTFIPIPKGKENLRLVVNHINGIPGDDRLENLEWCTYAENTQHAYDNNLHPEKVTPVLVMDFRKDKIFRFNSLSAACRYVKLPHPTARNRLRRQPGCKYGNFALKYDDESEWPEFYFRRSETNTPVICKNVLTGKCFIFESTSVAGRSLGIKQSTVSKAIREKSDRPIYCFVFRNLQKNPNWPDFSDRQLEIIRETPNKPLLGIVATDLDTGKETFYPSMLKAQKALNVDSTTIDNSVRRNKPVKNFILTKVKI